MVDRSLGSCNTSSRHMGRRKKLMRKVKKLEQSKAHGSTACKAPGASNDDTLPVVQGKGTVEEPLLSVEGTGTPGDQCQVTSLDLTVTYDYSCEEKSVDPVKSMEELSGLFPFKDTLNTSSPPSTLPSALWADFNPHPPLPKRTKSLSAGTPEANAADNQHDWRDLVSAIDGLKEAAAGSVGEREDNSHSRGDSDTYTQQHSSTHHWREGDSALHCGQERVPHSRPEEDGGTEPRWRQHEVPHQRPEEGGDTETHWREHEGGDVPQQRPGEGDTESQWRQSDISLDEGGGIVTHGHWREDKHSQGQMASAERDSGEDEEFWMSAALLLSQDTSVGSTSQDRHYGTSTLTQFEESCCPSNNSTSPSNSQQYNAQQIELKRIKAKQLLSQRKKKS